ncbi:MAG: GerMN domain-containing protein [Actinomycetia bacterium]|nr:GerMN domain-containing protein [Actinomycetes bacterium]
MELRPIVRILVGLVVVALVSVSCGDGGDQDANATSTTVTTTTTTLESTTSGPTSLESTTSTSVATTSSTTSTSTTTTAPPRTAMIFMTGPDFDGSDCLAVTGFEREVEPTSPIRSALDELVAGPTGDEAGSGVNSMFSSATAGSVRSINLTDGLLIVDFDDFRQLMPNATSSCGSGSLLAQLHATVFQFREVERVRYEIEGRCETFFDDWLPWSCAELDRSSPVP